MSNKTVAYDDAHEVVLVLPRELAEKGYWRDMEVHELECICEAQLRAQGLWSQFDSISECGSYIKPSKEYGSYWRRNG